MAVRESYVSAQLSPEQLEAIEFRCKKAVQDEVDEKLVSLRLEVQDLREMVLELQGKPTEPKATVPKDASEPSGSLTNRSMASDGSLTGRSVNSSTPRTPRNRSSPRSRSCCALDDMPFMRAKGKMEPIGVELRPSDMRGVNLDQERSDLSARSETHPLLQGSKGKSEAIDIVPPFDMRAISPEPTKSGVSALSAPSSTQPFLRGSTIEVQVLMVDKDIDAEATSSEYRQIVNADASRSQLPADLYAATCLIIVQDIPRLRLTFRPELMWRVGVVLFCMFLTLLLQCIFMSSILRGVLLPKWHRVQEQYKFFHSSTFQLGTFNQQSFDTLEPTDKRQICSLGISYQTLVNATIFMWVARCIDEFRAALTRERKWYLLPTLPVGVHPKHMIHELDLLEGQMFEEKKQLIVCLNSNVRAWLFAVVFVPRNIIAMLLLFLGAAFVTASETFEDLILNSLAMAFIYEIHQLVFITFLPPKLSTEMSYTSISIPLKFDSHHEEHMAHTKDAYQHSTATLILTAVFVAFWYQLQPIIPGYEYDIGPCCARYYESVRQIECGWGSQNCFPKG